MYCLGSCTTHVPAAAIHANHTCLLADPMVHSCSAMALLQHRVRMLLPAPALSRLVAEAEFVRFL